jgi:ribosome-binding ATPase YchF (GTP1/OBG family)
MDTDLEKADAVVFKEANKLDFILGDLEKIEKRLFRAEAESERLLLGRCQQMLEKEEFLCDASFSKEEEVAIGVLQLATFKPCLGKVDIGDMNTLIGEIINKAGKILFFTAAKKELRAWDIKRGESVLEAAGRIHSDLKRGFIKAEIIPCGELDNFFNLAQARARGLIKTVDKDYIVQDNDLIEIKFNI